VIVVVLAVGSRGDVQPYLALADGLRRAGHAVRFVTTSDFDGLAGDHGLEVATIPFSVQAALAEQATQQAVEGGGHRASFTAFVRIARTAARMLAETALEAVDGADLFVGGLSAIAVGGGVAERTDVPFLAAYNVPVDATSAWPGALLPNLRVGPRAWSNRVSHALTRLGLWLTVRAGTDEARIDVLGLPPLPWLAGLRRLAPPDAPTLYGISPTILPPPDDWPANRHVVGTWFLDVPAEWRPDADLEAFLAAGTAPVYIGFGSMGTVDAAATGRLVVDGVRAAGVRAVVHRGWARIAPSDELAPRGHD
jgi:sterol 3beta-glucosyltransferase